MPIMSLTAIDAIDDNTTFSSCHHPPVLRPHPHPLRSHSTENLQTTVLQQKAKPDTLTPPDTPNHTPFRHHHRRSRSVHSIDRSILLPTPPSPALAQQGIISASTERLGDTGRLPRSSSSTGSSGGNDFPVVPVRPPLRPTISFGGETRMSYYSISSTEQVEKEKPVQAVAVEEACAAVEGWHLDACFGVLRLPCLTPRWDAGSSGRMWLSWLA